MHKNTIQCAQEYGPSRLKDVETDNIPPLLIEYIITMNYIQTKAFIPYSIQTNFAACDHKTSAIQTNSNCLYGWQ